MSQNPDNLLLASLRRRLTPWRVVVALILAVALTSFFGGQLFGRDYIARVEITGVIFQDHARYKLLHELAKDDRVRAVIIHINSPGGTITGSEDLYLSLRALAKVKPVVAVMGEIAASGGYIAALGADRIFAHKTTITGSVGVIFQWFEFSELAKKIGVQPHALRSGELKALPDAFIKPSEKVLRNQRALIKEGFDWFIDLVAQRRNLDKKALLKLVGDGRVFSGKRAVQNRLVDDIGGVAQARAWLAREHNISGLLLYDRAPEYPDQGVLDWLVSRSMAKLFKMTGNFPPLAPERRGLRSGLMALWQPSPDF